MRMPFSRNTMSMGPGSNKSKKKSQFPVELDTLVNIKKVNLEVIKPWITKRVTELLGGVEDEVLIGMIFSYLEDTGIRPKEMMINLLSFLEKNTSLFMKELWSMLISAQESADGVPMQLIFAKQEEQRKHKEEIARIQASLVAKSQSIDARSKVNTGRVSRFTDAMPDAPAAEPQTVLPGPPPRPPPKPPGDDEKPEKQKEDVNVKERQREPQTKTEDSRSRSRSPLRRATRSQSRSPDKHSRRRRSPSPQRRRSRSRSPPKRRERTPDRRDRDRDSRREKSDRRDDYDHDRKEQDPSRERGDRHKRDRSDREHRGHKDRGHKDEGEDQHTKEEFAALKVIGATEKKVDTLEEQVLGRIDSGSAGVKEVEAVLEFLAQALEALDGVDVKNSDRVRAVRKNAVARINSIMDRVEQCKEKAMKKKRDAKAPKKVEDKVEDKTSKGAVGDKSSKAKVENKSSQEKVEDKTRKNAVDDKSSKDKVEDKSVKDDVAEMKDDVDEKKDSIMQEAGGNDRSRSRSRSKSASGSGSPSSGKGGSGSDNEKDE